MEKHYHWLWGENNLRPDRPNYLIHLEEGLSIRFDYGESMFASYEDFYESIADVQFLGGHRPDDERIEELKQEAWDYLCLEEDELENFMEEEDWDE
jgi:hypothetical protein